MADSIVRNSTVQQKEIWKPVKEFEGIYDVSNHGRVRSYYKYKVGTLIDEPRVVSINFKKKFYPCVTLCKNKKRYKRNVHRLVAETFIDNPDNKPVVAHKDDIKSNNHVENLYWATHKENTRDIKKNGNMCWRGEGHHTTSFLKEDIIEIRGKYKNGERLVDLGEEYGVTPEAIRLIVHRKNWKHV